MSANKTTRALVSLIGSAVLTICTEPGTAVAVPPGFPDFDMFTEIPVDSFFMMNFRGGPNSRTVNFSTPYNMNCAMDARDPQPPGAQTGIQCTGDLPDTAPGSCIIGTVGNTTPGSDYDVVRTPSNCSPFVSYGKQLGVGQKVGYRNVTCAVAAERLFACLDTEAGPHGFLLRPAGSLAF